MTRLAYFNGRWIAERELAIAPTDIGFMLGVTVTERLRTFGGQVWRQPEHIRRLVRSLEIVGLEASIAAELDAAITEYNRRHADQRRPDDDWAIVAFATPGDGHGPPTRVVHGFPLPFSSWARQFDEGVATWVSEFRQVPPNCWPAELKCRSRMHYYLADRDARRHDPAARAILVDQEGFVSEASTANVVVVRSGEGILTPRLDKVLPGVSVGVIAELAQVEQIPFIERDIALAELRSADEVWLSSTSICAVPVTRVNGEAIGSGQPGPLYGRIMAAWSALVGLDIIAQARRQATATP